MVVVTVTAIEALLPPLPVTVNEHEPAAAGVMTRLPVVVAGAVAIATPADVHVETPNPPVLGVCETATVCA
jgi:hypothetical protein